MKRMSLVAACLSWCAIARAQTMPPITTTPLLPPSVQPQSPLPDQKPLPPQAPPSSGPAPIQSSWVPQTTAQLQVLDKVNAQNAVLTVKVGQEARFASLNILVQACDIHPPDQPRDSAAFLTVTDSHSDAPAFHGWMLANEPSVSMLQNPIYDVRVVACGS
jgi:hypothetical protein